MEDEKKKVGGQPGNTNSSKNNRLWANTIRRAVVQDDANRLRRIAEALLDKAADGDISAIKELGDRLDGKSVSTTELTGADGSEFPLGITVKYVKPDSTD
jgi:phosphoribosylformylglycinamidine (FGAM) synthase-like enzyme